MKGKGPKNSGTSPNRVFLLPVLNHNLLPLHAKKCSNLLIVPVKVISRQKSKRKETRCPEFSLTRVQSWTRWPLMPAVDDGHDDDDDHDGDDDGGDDPDPEGDLCWWGRGRLLPLPIGRLQVTQLPFWSLSSLGLGPSDPSPSWTSAGWAKVDRWDGLGLMGKLLTRYTFNAQLKRKISSSSSSSPSSGSLASWWKRSTREAQQPWK